MKVYKTFDDADSAVRYRREEGTGGWIFSPEKGETVLFPYGMTASECLNHLMSTGNGKLIGCQ